MIAHTMRGKSRQPAARGCAYTRLLGVRSQRGSRVLVAIRRSRPVFKVEEWKLSEFEAFATEREALAWLAL